VAGGDIIWGRLGKWGRAENFGEFAKGEAGFARHSMSPLGGVVSEWDVILMIQNLPMKSIRRISAVSAKPLGNIPLSMLTPTDHGYSSSARPQ
jgi:hypothetical protein